MRDRRQCHDVYDEFYALDWANDGQRSIEKFLISSLRQTYMLILIVENKCFYSLVIGCLLNRGKYGEIEGSFSAARRNFICNVLSIFK